MLTIKTAHFGQLESDKRGESGVNWRTPAEHAARLFRPPALPDQIGLENADDLTETRGVCHGNISSQRRQETNLQFVRILLLQDLNAER